MWLTMRALVMGDMVDRVRETVSQTAHEKKAACLILEIGRRTRQDRFSTASSAHDGGEDDQVGRAVETWETAVRPGPEKTSQDSV